MEDIASILRDIERRLKDLDDAIRKTNDILATLSQAVTLYVVSSVRGQVEEVVKSGIQGNKTK